MQNNISALQKISGLANTHKSKVEIAALAGLFLWGAGHQDYPHESTTLLTVSISLLACTYYLITFFQVGYTVKSSREIFVFKLFHVSAPVVLIGLLFTLLGLKNGSTILIAGVGTLMSVVFMGYGLLKQRSVLINKVFMLRAFVLFLLPIILYTLQLIIK